MEQIQALHQRLSREGKGRLNLMYMNALAEIHNYAPQLGVDFMALEKPERTAFMRRTGDQLVHLSVDESGASAVLAVSGSGALPNTVGLACIAALEPELCRRGGEPFPITLQLVGRYTAFLPVLDDLRAFYPGCFAE